MTLDEYINLKGRVEARMKVTVMTATGDDNLLSPEEKDDLEYRRRQLERLKEDVVDLEELRVNGTRVAECWILEEREVRATLFDGTRPFDDVLGVFCIVRLVKEQVETARFPV